MIKRFILYGLVALALTAVAGTSLALVGLAAQGSRRGSGTGGLRSDEIRTRFIFNGSVTAGKLALKSVAVTVAMGAATGSSAADATLAGGSLLGILPAGNQDQFVDNVVLNANGSITVTLAANATAANTYTVTAVKANAQGTN